MHSKHDKVTEEYRMAGHIQDMTKGRPAALFLRLAVPVCFENTLWMVLAAAVNVIISKGVGTQGLAAIGASTFPYNLFSWFSFGFAQCISGVIGMYFGLGDERRMKEGVSSGIFLTVCVGTVLSLAGIMLAGPILRLLGTPADIFPYTKLYLTVQYAAILTAMMHYALSFMMIAFGNGIDPIIDILVLGGTAVVLSYLFVFVLQMGVVSGALALTGGYIAAAVFDLHALRKMGVLASGKGAFRISGKCLKEMNAKSIPFALQLSVAAVGGMLMQKALNAQGAAVVAGFAAASSICSIMQGVQNGCGYAMNSYVSQNYGAGKEDRIRQGLRTAIVIGLVLWAVAAVIQVLGGHLLLRLYVNQGDANAASVMQAGYRFLCIMSAFSFVLYLLYISRSALVGIGKSAFAIFGTAAEILGRGWTAALFPVILGLPGVYFSECSAWLLCGLTHFAVFLYFLGKMKKN